MSDVSPNAELGVGNRSTPAPQPQGKGSDAKARGQRMLSPALANGAPVAFLLAWWVIAQRVPPYILPDPIDVAEATANLLVGSDMVHTYTSFVRVLIAVLLSLLMGGLLVMMANLLPATEALVGNRILPFLNSIPSLGWAIIGVVWFGVSNLAVIFVLTAILLPFCMVNLWEGTRAIDRGLIEMGRSFTRSRWAVLRRIELPLLMPYVFAAVRLSFSVGWKVALIAEFFGARRGLGLVMNRARQNFDTPLLFAAIVVVLIIVFIFERLVFDRVGKAFALRTGTGASA